MREMKDSGIEWIGKIPLSWKVSKVKFFYDCYDGKRVPVDSAQRKPGSYPYWGAGSITDYVDDYLFDEELILVGEDGAPFFDKSRPVSFYVKEKIWVNNHIHVLKVHEGTSPKFLMYFFNAVDYGSYINGSILNKLTQSKMDSIAFVFPSSYEQTVIANFLDKKCSQIDSVTNSLKEIIEKLRDYKLSFIAETVIKGINPCADMRDSGVEWLGKIPANWSIFRTANLYDQTNEKGSEELPILTVSINSGISDRELDEDEQDRVFARSEDRTKYKRVAPGDLAYNMMRAWQGAFGAVRVDGMVSPAYITCRPKAGVDIDTRYIEYLFRSPMAIEEMHRHSHGVADFRLRLYWPEFKNIKLCLPPIDEQSKIADHIDKVSAAIDDEINRIQLTVNKLNDYKKSLIYEVVTGKKEVCSL